MNNEEIIKLTTTAALAYIAAYVGYKLLLEAWCIAYSLVY
jgi:hypothetical protein